MEPGDYLTNALSVSSYSSIQYEYLELSIPSRLSRQHLHQVESSWREEGALVYRDQLGEGIWLFQSASHPNKGSTGESSIVDSSNIIEARGISLSLKDRGVYEPANLARGKSTTVSNFGSPTPTSSPSSSLESSARNAYIFLNSKAVQTNAQNSAHEPLTGSPGAKSGISQDNLLAMKDIHALFISAVLSSVSYFLCRDCGFIPLNSRTFVMRTLSCPDPSIVLATIDVNLTSLGTLVVKAFSEKALGIEGVQTGFNLSKSPLIKTRGPPMGTPLWLGPTGNPARFHSFFDEKQIRGSSSLPQSQISPTSQSFYEPDSVMVSSWRAECLEWLSVKGLDPSKVEQKGWVMVQILKQDSPQFTRHYNGVRTNEDVAIIPWPASLCFQISGMEGPNFMPSRTQIPLHNPLSFAEEWFTGQDVRAATKLKRQKEKQNSEASSKERAESDSRAQLLTGHSPAALRRSSNAGAVYPTPPDGVNHPVGATPSFDGTVSSPGNANQLFTNENDIVPPTNMADTEAGSGSPGVGMDVILHEEDGSIDKGGLLNSAAVEQEDTLMEDLTDTANVEQHQTKLSPSRHGAEQTKPVQGIHESNALNGVPLQPSEPVITPPFNMTTIFKQFFPEIPKELSHVSVQQQRRTSIFNKLQFEASLKSVNEKYELHGRFDYSDNDQGQQPLHFSDLPRTDYLSRRRRTFIEEHNIHSAAEILIPKIASTEIEEEDLDIDSPKDSAVSSRVSDQDDVSYITDANTLNPTSGIKRKRNIEDEEQDDIASSLGALMVDYDRSLGSPASFSASNLHLFASDPGDWPLGAYFSIPGPETQYRALSDSDYVATAQIIADQAISGTFRLPQVVEERKNDTCTGFSTARDLAQCLVQATKSCLNGATVCNMASYLDIQGIPVLTQGMRMQPRPLPVARAAQNSEAGRSKSLFTLPPPEIEVQRSDSKLTILPSAVNFWETLGLSPSEGSKDVEALCVYPNLDGVVNAASTFLDEMRSVYESYKLGTHDRIVSKEAIGGLLSFDAELCQRPAESLNFGDLKETTLRISKILSSLSAEGSSQKNLVVYFIYPVNNDSLLMHICASFKLLFDFYRKALVEKKLAASNELVLQLIPLDLVASATSIKIPSPTEYVKLAMQVYDRCVNFASSSSPPAILLDQPLPKTIDFKLSTNQSASVLQENTCLHVAYAQSIDDRWITAAWTDNRGNRQMTSSYCLGRKHEALSRTFSEVANEVWQTTLDIVSQKKIHWRIMIAKAGTMDQMEIDCWISLAAAASDIQVSLTLITAKSEPSLRLLPTPSTLQPPTHISQTVMTPVSTPQTVTTSIVSPESTQTIDPSSGHENPSATESLTVPSEAVMNAQVSMASNEGGVAAHMSGRSPGNAAAIQNVVASPENVSTPARDTPGSAPTPAVDSPANPGTPGDISSEPDIDARIIDYTDECWGAILSHRLNNSNSLLDLNLALISGYIIKRGGTSSDEPPVLLEINIVHSDVIGNTRTFYEGLLREIIGYYRGLGTLARVRGVVDPVKDGRPWHIAAAEKAVKALYMLL
ncbi:hypothetical protein B7463_g1232, partial [Scytalidium lignicola]